MESTYPSFHKFEFASAAICSRLARITGLTCVSGFQGKLCLNQLMNITLNILLWCLQVQTIAPQGKVGDVQLLAAAHPVLPSVQTSLWRNGVDAEAAAAGLDLPVGPAALPLALAPASISVSAAVQIESQVAAQSPAMVPEQPQPPGPVPAQAAALSQTPASTPIQVPVAVPAPALAPVTAPVSASGLSFEPGKVSATSSDPSFVIGKPQHPAPIPATLPAPLQSAAPAPVAAPALQPAGIQTAGSLPECASPATAQQNLEMTPAPNTIQTEPSVEVWVKHLFECYTHLCTQRDKKKSLNQ